MPRTKQPKKKQMQNTATVDFVKSIVEEMDHFVNNVIETEFQKLRDSFENFVRKEKLCLTRGLANCTIGELKAGKFGEFTTICDIESVSNIMNSTNKNVTTSTVKKTSKKLKRSVSLVEDEGYLTAGSNTSSDTRRSGRSRSQNPPRTTRVSRSLSRSKAQKAAPISSAFKTPVSRPPTNFGTVTPKMKPNTPQVVLRRPKQGEIAMSMQGSPLLVSGVTSDSTANVNIPLEDGRMISIQPQRGLRLSQLPELDGNTRRQLEALRDNLNKVVAMSKKRLG